MSMPIEGSQESESQEYTEPTGTETSEVEDHSAGSQEATNPFWGKIEKIAGPNVYKLIQPHLASADTEARNRISELNQRLSPWKSLAEQGITPEHVQQSLGVVRQLNEQPEAVFESLRSFLEREGRMPSKAELSQEVEDNEEDEEADPRDQQIQTLMQQQQAIAEFLQGQQLSQQQQQAAAEADTWLDTETSRVKAAGGFDDQDMQDIVRIAAFNAQQTGQDPENLDAAVAQFTAMRDRIRTAPRPGSQAPRIPSGPGGGTPSAGGIDPSKMSKAQRQDLVAQMLQRGSGQ